MDALSREATLNELGYVRPKTLDEALAKLNQPDLRVRVLAGGTDLLRGLKRRVNGIDLLVDVAEVPDLKRIDGTGDGRIVLGAGVTMTEILESPSLVERVPLLADGCRVVGGPQIRNQATVGGNVANGAACADLTTVLVCLEADALVVSAAGERRIPVADLVADLPGGLPDGSLIRAFEFTPPHPAETTAYLRLAPREAMSIARAALAILGGLGDDGRVTSLRLAWGAVFPHPRRVPEVETILHGRKLEDGVLQEAVRVMENVFLQESGDRWSAPYKRNVVTAFTERGLRQVLGGLA